MVDISVNGLLLDPQKFLTCLVNCHFGRLEDHLLIYAVTYLLPLSKIPSAAVKSNEPDLLWPNESPSLKERTKCLLTCLRRNCPFCSNLEGRVILIADLIITLQEFEIGDKHGYHICWLLVAALWFMNVNPQMDSNMLLSLLPVIISRHNDHILNMFQVLKLNDNQLLLEASKKLDISENL